MIIKYRKNKNYNILSTKINYNKEGINNIKEAAEKMLIEYHKNDIDIENKEFDIIELYSFPFDSNSIVIQAGYAIIEKDLK